MPWPQLRDAVFARVNAHEPRWTAFPGLRESALKRACLFCHRVGKQRSTDTEWHALFQCVECRKPRNRFRLALRSFPTEFKAFWRKLDSSQPERNVVSTDLATLVIKCRMDERLVCELA